MEWMKVEYEGEEVEAANFLDGMFVTIEHRGTAFVPDWKVRFGGGMDAPNFRKQQHRTQVFGLELREK